MVKLQVVNVTGIKCYVIPIAVAKFATYVHGSQIENAPSTNKVTPAVQFSVWS